ncbi:MAG: YfhO family protein [Lachnospiraceae bacterium]|nr:YfhO family protein [Lachnospiraceae bacterium]
MRKRDFAVLFGFTAVLLFAVFTMTGTTRLYGSIIDWVSQHSVLPEYYRQTLYETGEFLPELALQLGGGQNAYYFGYYGFLNPVYLPSYLMPGVSMVTYLQFASVAMLIGTVWLCFLWLRHIQVAFGKAAFSDAALYAATGLVSFATPFLFHSHRQVMFVDYMPFLLLALIGTDRFFARRRRGMLTVSIALLFFTSYYYAIPGVFVVTLYGIYRYVVCTEDLTFRTFWHWGWRFALCIITGAAVASILTVPSLVAIFTGREPGTKAAPGLRQLLIGDYDFAAAVCYSGYSMGMTAIAYLALCVTAVPRRKKHAAAQAGEIAGSAGEDSDSADKTVDLPETVKPSEKRAHRWTAEAMLAIGVLGCAWIPWVRFVLNGFLYTREKILIPFVPLAALLVARMFKRLFDGDLSLRRFTAIATGATVLGALGYLLRGDYLLIALFVVDAAGSIILLRVAVRKRNLLPLMVPVLLLALIVSGVYSKAKEKPLTREYAMKLYDGNRDRVIDAVLAADDGVFRSADFVEIKYGVNRLRGTRYLSTGFYSSLSNTTYLKLLYCDLRAANPTVNDISYTPQNDIFLQTILGVRYVASETIAPAGYAPVDMASGNDNMSANTSASGGNRAVRMYENPYAYTLVYAAKQKMSLREFKALEPADREIALLSYAVTEEDGPDVYTSPIEDTGITADFGLAKDANGNIRVASDGETKKYVVPIPDSLDKSIYIVTMRLAERQQHRTTVTVNGITNVLSGKDNSRPNDNFELKFVVSSSEPCSELTFEFTGEDVVITPPCIRRVPIDAVILARDTMTMATELNNPRNNRITGTITPTEAGVLVLSVPYDENWTVRINGSEVPTFKVDDGFVGCEISAGEQSFEMIYHAPGRSAGIVVSILGVLGMGLMVVVPRLRDKKHRKEQK